MKKRILCFMLTLVMLVSLIPISASAASQKVSEPAITVLKKMTTFNKNCYKVSDTQVWRNGYGTECTLKGDHTKHTITEKKADQALRENLAKLSERVSGFASSNKLSLKQNQHDALVLFTYDVGTAWMQGNGIVKTAIVNGADSNELLNAMASIGNNMKRRKVEVNMYYNGVYSNVVPDTYAEVTYDVGSKASMPQGSTYTMQFDTSKTVPHTPVPTRQYMTFLGWYLGDEWMPNLTVECAGKTLMPKWQPNGLKPEEADAAPRVNYTLNTSQLASTRMYSIPDTDEYIDKRVETSTVNVIRDYIAPDGTRWAEIEENTSGVGKYQRWVIRKVGSNGITGGGDYGAEIDVTVTVTNDFVNSRKNATVYSAKNGTYHRGDKLRIINTASADGYTWGQIAKSADDNTPIGWVALMYTNWESVKDSGSSNGGSNNNTNAIARATVTHPGYVNLRSIAGTDGKIVGSLANNDTVDIFEIKTVSGHQWGRAKGGWLCLTYCDVTMLNGNKIENITNEGALAYVFPGYLTEDVTPKVSPNDRAENVQRIHEFKDKDDRIQKVDLWPTEGENVNVHNMSIQGTQTWVKISWRVDLDKNGSDDTTKYGWVKMTQTGYDVDEDGSYDEGITKGLSLTSQPVSITPARFNIAANEVTVREQPGSGAPALQVKLNRGVNVKVNCIQLVGEGIWGYMEAEIVDTGDSSKDHCDGWINLSSKYVTRDDIPEMEGDETLTPIGKIATIVGADNVNVRITGSTSGKKIGSLRRGTTANILEISKNGDWYNLDIDVDKNPKTGSWVNKQYVEVKDGYVGGSNGSNGSNGSGSSEPVTTGIGVVANTYAGVNVRTGAGQSYPAVGKLLPGTTVKISETKTVGKAKWAHVEQGWVCMDYITMLKEETTYPDGGNGSNSGKGDLVGSYDDVETTKTTAVYTGEFSKSTPIYAEPVHGGRERLGEKPIGYRENGDTVTVYELLCVTEVVKKNNSDTNGDGHGSGTDTTTTITSYWARTNEGYVYNPQEFINLDALDEKIHTLTGSKTLNVRQTPGDGVKIGKLEQGDQVKITNLKIVNDKVWGFMEDYESKKGVTGWIRLDYMHEGAVYVEEKPKDEPTTPPANDPIIGAGGDNGGFVNNGGGYRYTGKVINTNKVNVRATASTTASVTTTLKSGQSLVIYETKTAENMAWGRCDAGWVYLYYVDLTPCVQGAIDSRVVANNVPGIIYSDSNCSGTVGTYAGMSVIDIYEIVGEMARTELGWVSLKDLL